MEWLITTPWINVENAHEVKWIEVHVDDKKHQLRHIPRFEPMQNWNERKSKFTPLRDWQLYWGQAAKALRETEGGVITAFPQLPAVVGMQQKLSLKRRKPVVSWIFNIGTCSPGLRQVLAKASLDEIDRFGVPTRREIDIYSKYLGLPEERFEFIPYHIAGIEVKHEEETQKPFIASLGSTFRDFPTFFKAVENLKLPTVVAAGKAALDGIDIPSNVETPFGISRDDCFRIAQQARINVVPLKAKEGITAAGQVTLVEAMHMGRPLVVTKCNGAEDYIIHGETGLLVEPDSIEDMQEAINLLWNDDKLRRQLGENARQYAIDQLSDQAGAARLERVLDEVEESYYKR